MPTAGSPYMTSTPAPSDMQECGSKYFIHPAGGIHCEIFHRKKFSEAKHGDPRGDKWQPPQSSPNTDWHWCLKALKLTLSPKESITHNICKARRAFFACGISKHKLNPLSSSVWGILSSHLSLWMRKLAAHWPAASTAGRLPSWGWKENPKLAKPTC